MNYDIDGRTVYASSFDAATGVLVRQAMEFESMLSSEDHKIRSVMRGRFPHRNAMAPAPSPELVDISITNRCGMGCSYCYRASTPEDEHGASDLVETVIRGFETPPYQVALGGGEPTLHPAFPSILRTARKLGSVPNYTTNGAHMPPDVAKATNEVCGSVAMTYHAFKGFAWFREHLAKLRDVLNVRLNVHLIADANVATNLDAIVGACGEIDPLSVVLLAYYPDVGRGNLDRLMTRTTYMRDLPVAIRKAVDAGVRIAFSEGLLPYFLSRPELGVETRFAGRSEGYYSCYVDHLGRMGVSSFDDAPNSPTVWDHTSQQLWEQLYTLERKPEGAACYECPGHSRCATPHDAHYLACAHAEHNRLPLAGQE